MAKKTITAIFSILVLSTILAAYDTTHGVGKDIFGGGNTISDTVTKAQQ